jgi:hypothetical protein
MSTWALDKILSLRNKEPVEVVLARTRGYISDILSFWREKSNDCHPTQPDQTADDVARDLKSMNLGWKIVHRHSDYKT